MPQAPRILIVNARIVSEGQIRTSDIWIKNGRIEAISTDLGGRPAETVIDAAGKILLPGLIDDQVHFRQPGMTHKGDIASESTAAVVGGITTFMDMPNTLPPTITLERLEEKFALAASSALANYSFYLGGANDNIDQIRALDPAAACGVKVFMGASTGNMLVDDPRVLEQIFAQAPTLVATHCEDTPTIQVNETEAHRRFGEAVPMAQHPYIRSAEACYLSSELAVDLARRYGTRLHVLHLSTEKELALFDPGSPAKKQITAEVCVHHLWFCDQDYPRLGSRIKCNPAIKQASDRDALIQGVLDGRIDIIATDHAPHTSAEKRNPYFISPSGLPLIQHALPLLLEKYHEGVFSLELIAEKYAHAPARLFQIEDRGYVREGYWADLVLVDLENPWTVTPENIHYKCGWSPFEGLTLQSRVTTTIVSGQLAWHNNALDAAVMGKRLSFTR
jgi:dihydroorotase